MERGESTTKRGLVLSSTMGFVDPFQHEQGRIITYAENLGHWQCFCCTHPGQATRFGIKEVRGRIRVRLSKDDAAVGQLNAIRGRNIAAAQRTSGCNVASGQATERLAYVGISVHGMALSTRGSPGNPSTRSPRMLRMMSLVPPSIVLAWERKNDLE